MKPVLLLAAVALQAGALPASADSYKCDEGRSTVDYDAATQRFAITSTLFGKPIDHASACDVVGRVMEVATPAPGKLTEIAPCATRFVDNTVVTAARYSFAGTDYDVGLIFDPAALYLRMTFAGGKDKPMDLKAACVKELPV